VYCFVCCYLKCLKQIGDYQLLFSEGPGFISTFPVKNTAVLNFFVKRILCVFMTVLLIVNNGNAALLFGIYLKNLISVLIEIFGRAQE